MKIDLAFHIQPGEHLVVIQAIQEQLVMSAKKLVPQLLFQVAVWKLHVQLLELVMINLGLNMRNLEAGHLSVMMVILERLIIVAQNLERLPILQEAVLFQ